MIMRRAFAMPNKSTFSIKPISQFVKNYIAKSERSVDPFARDSRLATLRNDLNPQTAAEHHMDAVEFCEMLAQPSDAVDLALFDPPYSPRQISECYKGIGRAVTGADTQNAALYRRVRDSLDKIIRPGGVVLSFGWHSNGMGKNDTICIAEVKQAGWHYRAMLIYCANRGREWPARKWRLKMPHTPGPWFACQKSFGAQSHGTPYIRAGSDDHVLCFLNLSGAYGGNLQIERAKADALLMAAAPDLLAALVEICEEADRLDLPLSSKTTAIAAVSKARVRPQ